MKRLLVTVIGIVLGVVITASNRIQLLAVTRTPTATTVIATSTNTPIVTPTGVPTNTPVPSSTPGATITPYPSAPLCTDSGANHDNSLFHTLWDEVRGCHYDHEHGTYPFTQEVADTFPGFDLYTLIGSVGVGHSNPSSPMENTMKHGGFKWDVTLEHSAGCQGAPEAGIEIGVNSLVVQYHGFGNYSVEFESRVHSALALMRQCRTSNPTDYGYIFVIQHQDYGARLAAYQGTILPYPDTPVPAYAVNLAPYFTIDCFGPGTQKCSRNLSRQWMLDNDANTNSTWISAPQALEENSGSPLFSILFRLRDSYQALDSTDLVYPFTMLYMCSSDGGLTYDPTMSGCRWNNSTTLVNQVQGEIPEAWDNLSGFDTDTRVGRITAEGYVTRFGELNLSCTAPSDECFPIKMVSAFVGKYTAGPQTFSITFNPNVFHPSNLPERDIGFCSGTVCAEGSPGYESSGWIGPNN